MQIAMASLILYAASVRSNYSHIAAKAASLNAGCLRESLLHAGWRLDATVRRSLAAGR